MVCSSNGTQDLIALSVFLLMTHMPVPVTISKFQIIPTGTTTLRKDQIRQESCMSGLDTTFGLQDGQPDAKHVAQMLSYQMEPSETYNATQTVKITLIQMPPSKHIRTPIETTATLIQETANQVSLTGSPKI